MFKLRHKLEGPAFATWAPVIASAIGAAGSVYAATRNPDMPDQKEAPIPDDEARRKAQERDLQRRLAGTGRAGTIYTGQDSASRLG